MRPSKFTLVRFFLGQVMALLFLLLLAGSVQCNWATSVSFLFFPLACLFCAGGFIHLIVGARVGRSR